MASSTSSLTLLFRLLCHRHDERFQKRAHQTCHACPSVRLVVIADTLHFSVCVHFALVSSLTPPTTCFPRSKHVVELKFQKTAALAQSRASSLQSFAPAVKVLSYLYGNAVVAYDARRQSYPLARRTVAPLFTPVRRRRTNCRPFNISMQELN